ncbi:ABC transporter permease, partial [bacterium]|nr:ABC transporter permease [bacterium]
MIRNYIKTALRNIRNQKVYAFINIAGLAIGICVAVFLFLFIDYELGFDSHVRDAEHLYRVVRHVETPTGIRHGGSNYFPLSKALRNDFSELSAVTQTYSLNDEVIWVDKQRFDNNLAMFVEADFFKMMQPQWIVEDVNRASDPGSVILTESLSLKYFGSLNTVGRRITLGDSLELSISGIVADPPKQSSLPYELLISWGAMKHYFNNDYLTRWNYLNGGSQAFLKLRQSVSKEDFEAQLDVFKLKYLDPEDHGSHSFHLQSLSDMHFDGRYGAQPYITSRTTLWAFGSTGLLILIVACINFVNLTTARAMRRAKEIGMRKVLGADRKLLLRQLMGETGVIIAIALLLGLGVVALVLPFVTAHLGVTMEVGRIFSGVSLGFFTGLFFFLLVINGLYPAMVLSRYQPAEALKSSRFTKGQQSTRIRNALVLFQFAVTQVLIVATLVIAAQVRYVGQKDLGFQKEGIVIVKSPYRTETAGQALRGRWMQ